MFEGLLINEFVLLYRHLREADVANLDADQMIALLLSVSKLADARVDLVRREEVALRDRPRERLALLAQLLALPPRPQLVLPALPARAMRTATGRLGIR